MKNSSVYRVAAGVALVLLIPLIAMQFSNEVHWNIFDFIVAGVLLFGTGIAFELILNKINLKYRALAVIALAVTLILIWAELAVGIFGSPIAGS